MCFEGCCLLRGQGRGSRKAGEESDEPPPGSPVPKADSAEAVSAQAPITLAPKPLELGPSEGVGGQQLQKTKWAAAVACASLLAAAVGGSPATFIWAGGTGAAALGIVPLLASLAWAMAAVLSNKTPSADDRKPCYVEYQTGKGTCGGSPDDEPSYVELDEEETKLLKWHQQRERQAEAALPALRAALREARLEDPEGFLNNKLTLLRYLRACNAPPALPAAAHAEAAIGRLRQTLAWRQEALLTGDFVHRSKVGPDGDRYHFSCPSCRADPMAHCYFPLGLDRRQRLVIYSSAARAAKKDLSGRPHICCELEANFGDHSTLGAQQMVWIVDFRGFSARQADPRVGYEAIKCFGTHYPERLAEVVLLGFPVAFTLLYQILNPLVDPVTRKKVRILRRPQDREAYVRRLWPDWMRRWLAAADALPPVEGIALPALPGGSGDPRVTTASRNVRA